MATAQHVLPFRRKREGRTNYKKRLALLKSGKPRLVIRRSSHHLLLQLVAYHPDGDRILCSVDSKTLAKQGWTHGTKSTPAAYFTGVLLGKAAKEKGVKEAIVDLGLLRFRAGTRASAAIKGAIDGGLAIPASDDVFPSAERIAGKHLPEAAAKDVAALATKLGVTLPAETKQKEQKAPKEEPAAKDGKKERPAKQEKKEEQHDHQKSKQAEPAAAVSSAQNTED